MKPQDKKTYLKFISEKKLERKVVLISRIEQIRRLSLPLWYNTSLYYDIDVIRNR